jgi:DNA-binding MarR family transcriptional regulator
LLVVTAGGSPVSSAVRAPSEEQEKEDSEGVKVDSQGMRIKVMSAEKPPDSSGVPSDLSIKLSASGGITGGGGGHTIGPDGTVTSWQKSDYAAQRQTKKVGKVDRATLERLVKLIDESGFFETDKGEASNMTTTLSVTRRGEQHAVEGSELPEALQPLQLAIVAAIRKAEHHRKKKH